MGANHQLITQHRHFGALQPEYRWVLGALSSLESESTIAPMANFFVILSLNQVVFERPLISYKKLAWKVISCDLERYNEKNFATIG